MSRKMNLRASPYGDHIRVLFGTHEEGNAWMRRAGCETSVDDAEGCTFAPDDGELPIYLWVRQEKDIVSLSHELIHVVFAVLHRAGVPLTFENDEAVAYLHTHLFGAVLARLAKPAPRPRSKCHREKPANRVAMQNRDSAVMGTEEPARKIPGE